MVDATIDSSILVLPLLSPPLALPTIVIVIDLLQFLLHPPPALSHLLPSPLVPARADLPSPYLDCRAVSWAGALLTSLGHNPDQPEDAMIQTGDDVVS